MKQISIRKADKNDVPAILEMIEELAEFEKLSDEVVADEKTLMENLFGPNKHAEVLLAEYEKNIAGQVLFFHNFSTFKGKPGIYIEDLYVKQSHRGKGIGNLLLKEVIKIAKERNCCRVEWSVLDWNTRAIDFYERLGAKSLNEWKIFRLTEDKF